jgi:small subunit ribosomal protein S1
MTSLPPNHDPADATPSPEPEEEKPSTEFAKALEEYEKAEPAAAAPAAGVEVKVGQKVHVKVVSVGEDTLLCDFGGRSEAVADAKLFRNEDGTSKVAAGEELDLFVVEAGEHMVLGPSIKPERHGALARLREALRAGVPVSGKVHALNSGGLAVDLGGARGFCPMSQIELGFCKDASAYVGKTIEFLILEVKDGKGGVVLSRRQLLRREEEEKGKKLLEHLKPGDELEGTVARLENFGAFVDLGGLDGLVHVSEISHERIGHPKQVLHAGQKVRVKVLRIEPGKDGKPRVALSIRASTPDPWQGVEARYTPGMRVSGTVARLTDFGAFVALEPGIDGLVHVSHASLQRIGHVKEVLSPGQKIEAVVLSVDGARKRLALSIRDALAADLPPARTPVVGEVVEGRVAGIKPFGVFVDLPEFGPRVAGLMPREESGQPRGADLAQIFPLGSTVRVEILEPKQGKVRLRLEGATPAAPPMPAAERPEGSPRRERGPRTGGGERGGRGGPRGERPERGREERGERGGGRGRRERGPREAGERRAGRPPRDPDRENSRPFASSSSGEEPPSPMALALRKAMEEARRKESDGS